MIVRKYVMDRVLAAHGTSFLVVVGRDHDQIVEERQVLRKRCREEIAVPDRYANAFYSH